MIKKNLSFLLIVSLSLFFGAQKINVTSSIEKGNYGVIDWDNFGYYMYLPAVFIHKDVKTSVILLLVDVYFSCIDVVHTA